MKRKFKEGTSGLTSLIKNHKLGSFLLPLALNYRSFGYFNLNKYQKALQDLESLQDIKTLDLGANYNKLILQGLIQGELGRFHSSMNFFKTASDVSNSIKSAIFYK